MCADASAETPPGRDAPQVTARPRSIKEYDAALREQRDLVLAVHGEEQVLAERKRLRDLLGRYREDVDWRSPGLVVGGSVLLVLGILVTACGITLLTTGSGGSWDFRGAAPIFLIPGPAAAVGGITMIAFGATRVMKEPEKAVYPFGSADAPAPASGVSMATDRREGAMKAFSLQFGPGGVHGAF